MLQVSRLHSPLNLPCLQEEEEEEEAAEEEEAEEEAEEEEDESSEEESSDEDLSEGSERRTFVMEKVMEREMERRVKKIMRVLMSKDGADVFCESVDLEAFPDYADAVKTPMDLKTVMSNVNAKKYTTPDPVVRDVRLTFANCHAYNGAGSDICLLATRLQNVFERLLDTWAISRSRKPLIELEDDKCQFCSSPKHDSQLMLCDGCDAPFHTFCLDPPLDGIPDTEWFCLWCAERKNPSEKKPKDPSSKKKKRKKAKKPKKKRENKPEKRRPGRPKLSESKPGKPIRLVSRLVEQSKGAMRKNAKARLDDLYFGSGRLLTLDGGGADSEEEDEEAGLVEDMELVGEGTAALALPREGLITTLPELLAEQALSVWDCVQMMRAKIMEEPTFEWAEFEAALVRPQDEVHAPLLHHVHVSLLEWLLDHETVEEKQNPVNSMTWSACTATPHNLSKLCAAAARSS